MQGVIYQDEKIVITPGLVRIKEHSYPIGNITQVRADRMSILAYPAALLGYGGLFALLVLLSQLGWAEALATYGLGALIGWGFLSVALAVGGAKHLTHAVRIDVAGQEVLAYSSFSKNKAAVVRAAIEQAISAPSNRANG